MNVFRWGQEEFEGSAFSLTPCFFWWCQKGYAGTTIFLFVLFPSDGGQGEFEGTNFPCLLWRRNKKSDQIRYILMNVLTNFPIKFDQVFVLFLLWVCFGKNIRIFIYIYICIYIKINIYTCEFFGPNSLRKGNLSFSSARTFERINGLFLKGTGFNSTSFPSPSNL